MACLEKENKDLKNENVSLMSKLNDLCEGNTTLKNKIISVEKQKEVALHENTSLKRKIVEKEKENVSKKNKKNDSHSHHALHATINQNEIKFLKNRIDCLSSTLSNCAFNHKKLESLFQKKQAPHVHAHHPQHVWLRAHSVHVGRPDRSTDFCLGRPVRSTCRQPDQTVLGIENLPFYL